jgi:hypothetical protein
MGLTKKSRIALLDSTSFNNTPVTPRPRYLTHHFVATLASGHWSGQIFVLQGSLMEGYYAAQTMITLSQLRRRTSFAQA